jgi:uncharacterized protein
VSRTRPDLTQRYGPTALVTGASSGIGRAIAVEVANQGIDLVLVARRTDVLEELADRLRAETDVAVEVVGLDLAVEDGATRLLERTAGLDIGLYVAAAGFGTAGDLVDADLAREVQMVRLNIENVLTTTYGFARRMAARGSGGIILFSSVLAFQGVPRSANYAATKAYVQTLAEGLAVELAPEGVDVLSTAPGPVATGFAQEAGMTMGTTLTPEVVAIATLNALGRRRSIAPGTLSRVLRGSLAPLPRRVRTAVMARVMAGMTADVYPSPSSPARPTS